MAIKKICNVKSCTRTVYSGKVCSLHYERWRKNGTYDLIRCTFICSHNGCSYKATDIPHQLCYIHSHIKYNRQPFARMALYDVNLIKEDRYE